MKKYVFFITLFLFPVLINSQSDTLKTKLQEIVVTAARTGIPAIELSASYTKFNEKTIELSNKPTVIEILEETPGISIIQSGGYGKQTSIFFRGANSNHALVIVDGVEMNDPSNVNNSFDIASLQTNNIETIEIVRGQMSTLYGSDALGGVINIITKKGNGIPSFSLKGEYGSNNFYKASGAASGAYNGLNFSLNFSRLSTDGISTASEETGNEEKDAYFNNSFSGKIGYDYKDYLSAEFGYRFIDSEGDLDFSFDGGNDDPDYQFKNEEQLYSGRIYSGYLADGKVKPEIFASYLKRISKTEDYFNGTNNLQSENYTIGERVKFGVKADITALKNNVIIVGAESELENAKTKYQSFGAFPYTSRSGWDSARTTGIFLNDHFSYNDKFFITTGVRYDDHDKFGSFTTYRIAPAFMIKEADLKLKAAFGTGFKSPSLYQLYDAFSGNPDLEPEESKGWEAGAEKYFFKYNVSFGLTYFQTDYENLIAFNSDTFGYVNEAEVNTKGVEVYASLLGFKGFSANAAYTFTETYDENAGGKEQLIRRPKHKVSVNLNYTYNKFNINSNIRWTGGRYDEDFVNYTGRVKLDSYLVIDLSANLRINEYFSVFGRIENLTDTDYEEVYGYGTRGISIYGGVKLQY